MNTAQKLTAIAENQQKVYDKGRDAQWSDFWDKYQEKGTKSQYLYAFAGHSWTDETFKPKHNISPSYSCQYMFTYSRITNLSEILDRQGVTMNLSRANSVLCAFQYCDKLTNIPEINLSGIKNNTNANMLFDGATSLETVEKLVFSGADGIQYYNAFKSCNSLKNVVFAGVVTRSINCQDSPLTNDSIKSLILCLKNYKNTSAEGAYTITLKELCKTALEAEGATSPHGNLWTEYVSDLGWVLA